jgi:dGTPase
MTIRETTEQIEQETLSCYATLSSQSKGRQYPIAECTIRTSFQRDRDKIIHAKSFRRLKHKMQVFLSPTGDHYRTRLTHTMEVSQIARTIARALRLNEDLTETIALAHDLGHTPFGHSGENVLNEICSSGFRHYEQSLRVVDHLENGTGLNLTFEVRDGIVNHAGDNEAQTLEGKIIKLADRIAYVNHDIDDAVRGGIISEEELPKECTNVLGTTHSQRIDTVIQDIIKTSMDKPFVKMSPEIFEAMKTLRTFMFDYVYANPIAKAEDEKAKNVIRILFETYTKTPEKLPPETQENIDKYGLEQTVTDYIAGMTDNFAIQEFNELFVPKKWIGN